jgi:hypothetical protein
METVYSKDIKDAANLMADDLVVACVFDAISFFVEKGLLLTVFFSFRFMGPTGAGKSYVHIKFSSYILYPPYAFSQRS